MPYFKWRGVDILGDWHSGKQFAQSSSQLDAQLFAEHIALIESKPIARRWFVRPITFKQKADFFQQLSVLINAGILVPEALSIVGTQVRNVRLQEIVYAIADEVQSGVSFGQSLSNYPNIFSKIMIQLVQSGQESGKLGPALQALCAHLQATDAFYARIRSALVMPIATLGFFCVIALVMFIFVIPRFVHIFASMKVALPPLTQTLLAISNFMRSGAMIIIGAVIICVLCGMWAMSKTLHGKQLVDSWLVRLPFIGSLLRYRFTAYFFHSVGMLLQGGMQLVPALNVVKQSMSNSVFREYIAQLQQVVDSGDSLSAALAQSKRGFFSANAVAMVMVGQESGALGKVLEQIALSERQQLHRSVASATTLLQPLLMIILGLLVSLLIFAIYQPILMMSHAL